MAVPDRGPHAGLGRARSGRHADRRGAELPGRQYPEGRVKDSRLGREGLKFAIEDMAVIRLLVVKEK